MIDYGECKDCENWYKNAIRTEDSQWTCGKEVANNCTCDCFIRVRII